MTSPRPIVIRGRVHVSLRSMAQCFEVQLSFVEQAYEEGLLGPGERIESEIAVAAAQLDRFARIVRWHLHSGIDLTSIRTLLDALDPD